MKKLLSIILSVVLLITAMPLGAFEFKASAATSGTTGDCTWTLEGTVLTISGSGSMYDYTWGGYSSPWRINITKVIIEDGVTSIGDYAFHDCDILKSVTIGNSVISIGEGAFSSCDSLTSIIIPNNVTSIGDYVFDSCSSLKSITFSDRVISIGDRAFYSCDSLTDITIPDSVISIGSCAFSKCTSLATITADENNQQYFSVNGILFNKNKTELICYPAGKSATSYVIPEIVTSIGCCAFDSCDSLTSITIPNSVTSIGSSAFSGCTSLTSITIPDSVTSIGVNAFYNTGYYNNEDNWENNVLYISKYLIDVKTQSLGSYNIKSGTLTVADFAFSDCSLKSVTIPSSVTSIGYRTFDSCDSLTSIIADENNQQYSSVNGVLFNKNKTELICYPVGKSATSYVIPESVTSIGDYAFYSCASLTNITLPDSVTSIGDYAFYYCDSLTSVTIGNSVTSIGCCAFDSCDSLTSVSLGDSVTSIGHSAFYYCTRLTNITIPDRVTSIGDSAFYSCASLTNITLPDSVTSIGDYAFYYCDRLTSVTIGNSVTSIGYRVFGNCTSLASITIPDSVTSINEDAFVFCKKLRTVYYRGTDSDRTEISIGSGNPNLNNATWYCNSCIGAPNHFYDNANDTDCIVCGAERVIYTPGNINDDEDVDLNDVVVLSQVVAKWSGVSYNEAALDVNGDGAVDLQDVTHLAQYVAKWQGIELH